MVVDFDIRVVNKCSNPTNSHHFRIHIRATSYLGVGIVWIKQIDRQNPPVACAEQPHQISFFSTLPAAPPLNSILTPATKSRLPDPRRASSKETRKTHDTHESTHTTQTREEIYRQFHTPIFIDFIQIDDMGSRQRQSAGALPVPNMEAATRSHFFTHGLPQV